MDGYDDGSLVASSLWLSCRLASKRRRRATTRDRQRKHAGRKAYLISRPESGQTSVISRYCLPPATEMMHVRGWIIHSIPFHSISWMRYLYAYIIDIYIYKYSHIYSRVVVRHVLCWWWSCRTYVQSCPGNASCVADDRHQAGRAARAEHPGTVDRGRLLFYSAWECLNKHHHLPHLHRSICMGINNKPAHTQQACSPFVPKKRAWAGHISCAHHSILIMPNY
jgi:hypothetical protein